MLVVALKNLCGRGAGKCHQPHVLVDSLPDALQGLCYGVIGQMRLVVLFGEVAQPDLTYLWRVVLGQEFACFPIG